MMRKPRRRLHRTVLERIGCQCVEAKDAATALAEAERGPFDLVLLDVQLPDGNGYDVCRRLRESGMGTALKIIIVSGMGDVDTLAEALPRGADDYIAKPFHPRQMKAKVQHAFRTRDAQQRSRVQADELLQVNRRLRQSLERVNTMCVRHTMHFYSRWQKWPNRATVKHQATCAACRRIHGHWQSEPLRDQNGPASWMNAFSNSSTAACRCTTLARSVCQKKCCANRRR